MRTREKIENEDEYGTSDRPILRKILEVMLDIRELLTLQEDKQPEW